MPQGWIWRVGFVRLRMMPREMAVLPGRIIIARAEVDK